METTTDLLPSQPAHPRVTIATSTVKKEKIIPTYYGFEKFHPQFLQCFANRRAFLIVFCITCVLQGTFHTYFVAVITTLEKLFNIPSRTIGTLMMASEVGQVCSSLFLPYYAGQGHRPRWMGFGSALFAFATLLCASPHFLLPSQDFTKFTMSGGGNETVEFCATLQNETSDCVPMETDFDEKKYYIFGIIFASLLSIGFGNTAIFTLGIPYLDDNVANRDSPVYFSITIGVRILGPVTGFILGSLCTRLYIHPLSPPPFPPTDPRWLGAWWLGMLLISFLLLVTSFFMCMFPQRLSNSTAMATKQNRSLGNFPSAIKRLLSNRILLLRTFSSVFHLLPISGLYTFLPKYLESQFKLAAFEANIVTGIGGILVMGVGIFGSGVWIRRRETSGVKVAVWVGLCAGVYAGGIFLLSGVGCGVDTVEIGSYDLGKPSCLTPSCTTCANNYSPVCGSDMQTYLSPCHAGCTGVETVGNVTMYTDCSCIQNHTHHMATPSPCPSPSCPYFPLYLAIFMTIVLVHSTSEVGSMLLTLRCVEPRDKAMALGLIQCAIGLFGNVPCPVIYGTVVDQACVLWGGSGCDSGGGHCWVYDGDKFRLYFHGLTGSIMLIAFLIDLIIISKAKEINFNDNQPVAMTTEDDVAMEPLNK